MLFWLACAPAPDTAPPMDSAAVSQVPLPQLDAERTADQAMAAVGAFTSLPDPNDVREIYQALYDEGAHGDCPGTDYDFNGPNVSEGCTTPQGWVFAGAADFRVDPGHWALQCDCRIQAPDGRVFQGAGTVDWREDASRVHAEVRGSWSADPAPDWLQGRNSSLLSVLDQDRMVWIQGGTTVHGESLDVDLRLGNCPSGTLELRDPSGGWFELELQECSGCGTLWFGDRNMGWQCPDLDVLRTAGADVVGL